MRDTAWVAAAPRWEKRRDVITVTVLPWQTGYTSRQVSQREDQP